MEIIQKIQKKRQIYMKKYSQKLYTATYTIIYNSLIFIMY